MKSMLFVAMALSACCGSIACAAAAPAKSEKAAPAAKMELVRDGKPRAVLLIDSSRYPLKEDLTDQYQYLILERPIHNIASVIAEYVLKSTGAKLPVVDLATSQPPTGQLQIYIGRSKYVDDAAGHLLAGMDQSGFLIRAVDDKHLIIAGSTSEGTEFGTFEFLERFVGIRWLFPTDVGDYVPKLKNLAVPDRVSVKEDPAFMQVVHLTVRPHEMWARRMRFWERIKFHHNLKHLFPPEKYTATHPEFYPCLMPGSTERFLPPPNTEDWQPCFTAPGIVDEAAKTINAYLDTNPRIKSYSFGINDTSQHRYCKCENCLKEYIPGETFLGMPSYSDVYYKFCNAVIAKVLVKHPDTWFGCLAYNNVGKPPVNVRLHPRLIPFLTYDTMQMLDPERCKNFEALVDAWGKKCTFVGRYDYTYGADHVPPRIYIHEWAEHVRWARDHKVKAWYAETYAFFGEAPKYYAMSRIWWNPDRNVDDILNEWYRLAFGKAAVPMKAYFDHWENYWTKRVPNSGYFKMMKDEQFLLGGTGWMEQVQESDIVKADAWMAQARRLANTPETKARVDVMMRSWEYYRAVMRIFLARGAGGSLSVDKALAVFTNKELEPDFTVRNMHEKLSKDPILFFSWLSNYPYKNTEKAPFLDGVESYLDNKDERLTRKLEELSRDPDKKVAALADTVLRIADGKAQNLVPNSSFEESEPGMGWWVGTHMGTGPSVINGTKPFEGTHVVEVTGTSDGFSGAFRTDIPVQPGKRYLYVARARSEGKPGPSTKSQLVTYYLDATGVEIPETRRLNVFQSSSKWRAFGIETAVVPAGAVSIAIRVDALAQPQIGHSAYFDNLNLYEIGESSSK